MYQIILYFVIFRKGFSRSFFPHAENWNYSSSVEFISKIIHGHALWIRNVELSLQKEKNILFHQNKTSANKMSFEVFKAKSRRTIYLFQISTYTINCLVSCCYVTQDLPPLLSLLFLLLSFSFAQTPHSIRHPLSVPSLTIDSIM